MAQFGGFCTGRQIHPPEFCGPPKILQDRYFSTHFTIEIRLIFRHQNDPMQTRLLDLDTALITDRTVVRRFRENDGQALYELLRDNHTRLLDHFPRLLHRLKNPEEAEFFVRRKLAAWVLQEEYAFGLWENKSAALIGMLRIFHIDWTLPLAKVDFFVDQAFSGRGLMTEALGRLVEFAFDRLELEKLVLRTAMDNFPSQRLARKCGFRREGDLRAEQRREGGELIDVMLFGLTRSEYLKV